MVAMSEPETIEIKVSTLKKMEIMLDMLDMENELYCIAIKKIAEHNAKLVKENKELKDQAQAPWN